MPLGERPDRPNAGLDLKTLFTQTRCARYGMTMLLLAAATVAMSSLPALPQHPTAATAQARVVIRIVSGVRLRFDRATNEGAPTLHETVIRAEGPALLPAKLIEFE